MSPYKVRNDIDKINSLFEDTISKFYRNCVSLIEVYSEDIDYISKLRLQFMIDELYQMDTQYKSVLNCIKNNNLKYRKTNRHIGETHYDIDEDLRFAFGVNEHDEYESDRWNILSRDPTRGEYIRFLEEISENS